MDSDRKDLELLMRSGVPLLAIESHEEQRVLQLLANIADTMGMTLFNWMVTEGLQWVRGEPGLQPRQKEPTEVLQHIKSTKQAAVYVLLDFHPYLGDPVHVRLIKDIVVGHAEAARTLILLSHELELPAELRPFSARFQLSLPDHKELGRMVWELADEWARERGSQVSVDAIALEQLINGLTGLTLTEARRLARHAIYDDGAVTHSDVPNVMEAKYALLNRDGVLAFEYETARFDDLAGMTNLKQWLAHRRDAFTGNGPQGLDTPKGVLLLGVQGCGKSLAAKCIAGDFGVPLLKLDFGALYNKFHGETERNLRASLKSADVMAPCVLWIDEIEKGLATDDADGGTSKRVLATLLTWMAERRTRVFLVATANDVSALPPELIRKGRFDEIFFVDLPSDDERRHIFTIHLQKRGLAAQEFDVAGLARAAAGFSGAEIEQVVVSALYAGHARKQPADAELLLQEIDRTRPLSIVMAERVAALRAWAEGRTVAA